MIVSPPGLAHRRLTPDNREDLLFDDVFWVKQAIRDHGVFADIMRGEGVEVLDAMALLGETLDILGARAWVLDHRITRNDVGVGMREELRVWMEELPGVELARFLVGGIKVDDLHFTPSGMFGIYLGQHGFILPPLPNFIFTRDNSAWVYGGVSLNPMHFAARRPETLLLAVVYRFHPTFAGKARVWFGDPTQEFGAATPEGGDVMPIGHGVVMVGMGERSTPQAVGQLAEALFKGGDVHRVIACQMPRSRAAMHLDTVFTRCGGDVVTTSKEVADAIKCYDLRSGQGKAPLDIRGDARHLFDITAEILGHKKLHLVPTGGSDAAEQSREQWNAGNNMGDSLLIGGARMGMDVRLCAPKACWPDPAIQDEAQLIAKTTGARITITEDVAEAVKDVDFIYTDVWLSMGEAKDKWEERIRQLIPYQVNAEVMAQTGNQQTKFMHCLPAFHNADTEVALEIEKQFGITAMEVTEDVFESPASIVFDQAENRLHTIKAVLVATLGT